MRVYLAGKITGNDGYREQFRQAADRLRAEGWDVINPAENPEPPCKSWAGYMREALGQLVASDSIALLPGWEDSRGARLEHHVASELGLTISYLAP